MTKGCEWEKRSFTVSMHAKDVNLSWLDKTCEVCVNHKTEKCNNCVHWRYFKRREDAAEKS